MAKNYQFDFLNKNCIFYGNVRFWPSSCGPGTKHRNTNRVNTTQRPTPYMRRHILKRQLFQSFLFQTASNKQNGTKYDSL